MFHTTQKIIQIGSSKGVILPAKELKQMGVSASDTVKVTIESQPKSDPVQKELMTEYNAFLEQYGTTLKNLADR